MKYFLGVDVGTSSARVGLFNENGKQISYKTQQISIFSSKQNYYEQSSDNIWHMICTCIRSILQSTALHPDDILSISFAATCSLVVLDKEGKPLSVSEDGQNDKNIIMWMDHRAEEQASFINSTAHECLSSVGGKISCEMDLCKVLWLKENKYDECYSRAAHFFSLPDYLFWRSTGLDMRSVCCVTCKWLYQEEWNADFLSMIGLDDLDYAKIGTYIDRPFNRVKNARLSEKVAKEMGLTRHTQVGISLIDAHAGGIGALSFAQGNLNLKPEQILIIVSGTSTCHMASSVHPKRISGIWGPYLNAMVPHMWLNEAGQSAAGSLLDFIIKKHQAFNQIPNDADHFEFLNDHLTKMAISQGLDEKHIALLTKSLHYHPDFHGNRSPYANSTFKGAIHGLDFDVSLDSLALNYYACLQSLVYQSRQIIQHMKNEAQYDFKSMVIIGGLAKNKLYCQLHSDVCHIQLLVPHDSDSIVSLGACISGAANTQLLEDCNFDEILKRFSQSSVVIYAPDDTLREYHEKKYEIFEHLASNQFYFNSNLVTRRDTSLLKKAFLKFSSHDDKQGLSKTDFKTIWLYLFGYKPSKFEASDVFKRFNKDYYVQQLNYAEFEEYAISYLKRLDYVEELRNAFITFDFSCKGFLTIDDFKKAFSIVAPNLSFKMVQDMFKELDRDCDDRVSYKDFEFAIQYFNDEN